MSDKREDQLTTVSDMAYVRAIDSNGNSIRISKADLASVVAGLIGTATPDKNGLMSANDKKYFNLISFGSGGTNRLIKIAEMRKTAGGISPFGIFFWEKYSGITTFGVSTIINRSEGIHNGIKNLGPGQTRIRMYYKESGDTLSVYLYLEKYTEIILIFANTNGLKNGIENVPQSSTDTSGMTQFTVIS